MLVAIFDFFFILIHPLLDILLLPSTFDSTIAFERGWPQRLLLSAGAAL